MNNLPIQTYESVVQQRDALEKKLADMVAESNAIKDAAQSLLSEASIVYSKYNETQQPDKDLVDMQTLHGLQAAMRETPATDAFINSLMGKSVDALADHLSGMNISASETSVREFADQIRKGINDAQ